MGTAGVTGVPVFTGTTDGAGGTGYGNGGNAGNFAGPSGLVGTDVSGGGGGGSSAVLNKLTGSTVLLVAGGGVWWRCAINHCNCGGAAKATPALTVAVFLQILAARLVHRVRFGAAGNWYGLQRYRSRGQQTPAMAEMAERGLRAASLVATAAPVMAAAAVVAQVIPSLAGVNTVTAGGGGGSNYVNPAAGNNRAFQWHGVQYRRWLCFACPIS